nr:MULTISPECIES: YwbE family protein [unclassified Methanosarcina]
MKVEKKISNEFQFFKNVLIYIRMNLPSAMNNGSIRANIKEGLKVGIVLKQDQRTGKITQGVVKRILTNSSTHPHGIKVQLTDGQVGRVKEIYSKAEE